MKFKILIISLFISTINAQNHQFDLPIKGLKEINCDKSSSLFNKSINNTITSNSNSPTGNSPEIGNTTGELSVNLSGGATYNIPIIVPPGINNVTPNISLNYNSQSGNGIVGYGWNLAGISSISRVAATKYHDNFIDPVDFNNLDRFAIDGQRLFIKNGTTGNYGQNGTIYETENFSNIKITSFGVHPNGSSYGPAYFVVQYPDGSIAEYGNSSDSRTITEWSLTFWQNPQGARITFNYLNSNNCLSITSIKYGSLNTASPINEIQFVYKNRYRPEQSYVGGQSVFRNNILSEVKVLGNGIGYRNYVLNHDITTLGYERLKSITEKSGDNTKELNPTVFDYENTDNSFSSPILYSNISTINDVGLDNSSTISGDFNGDGEMDFLVYPTTGINAKKKYLLFSNLAGNSNNVGYEHNLGKFEEIFSTTYLSTNNQGFKMMPEQGWCAITINPNTNITTFTNYNSGTANPVNIQDVKNFEFPKFSYTLDCTNLVNCSLSPLRTSSNPLKNEINSIGTGIDPIDPNPNPSNCSNPINIQITPININNQSTLTWENNGILPYTWEIYYTDTISNNIPLDTDPFGNYTSVNQTTYTFSNLNSIQSYLFYIRSICIVGSEYIPGPWIGPISLPSVNTNPVVIQSKVIPKFYLNGDFNGDGISDVIAIDKSIPYETRTCLDNCYTTSTSYLVGGKAYFVNLDKRLISNFVNDAGNLNITNNSKFYIADFNGDGKSDIFVFDNSTCRVYSLSDSNNLYIITSLNSNEINLSKPILIGDYNGDGKSDFIIPKTGYEYKKFLSSGNSIITSDETYEIAWQPQSELGLYFLNIIPIDINNDGKTDLVKSISYRNDCCTDMFWYNWGGNFKVSVFHNTGSNFQYTGLYYDAGWNPNIKSFPLPIFLSKKQRYNTDLSFITGNSIYSFHSNKDFGKERQLKQITLGNGLRDIIIYDQLNQNSYNGSSSVYTPSLYTENYPNFDIKVANNFNIVSRIEQISVNQYLKKDFKYYGAVSNFEGLGLIGFRGIASTNWYNDDYSKITTVSKNDINKRGAVVETYSILGEVNGNFTSSSPSSFIQKQLFTYNDITLNNKVYKIQNTNTTTINGLDGTSIEVTNVYNLNNSPVNITTLYKTGNNIDKTETQTFTYFPILSSGLSIFVDRLNKKNTSKSHDGDTMSSEEIFTYNTSNLITKYDLKGHLTNFITTEYIYDSFGNVINVKKSANGLTPRIKSFTFDNSGRFVTTSVDENGLTTSYTYNSSNGLLLTELSPSNLGYPLITSYTYDVWGKLIKETDYLGKSKNYTYSWLTASQLMLGSYAINISSDDNSFSTTWFDDLNRKVAEGRNSINDVTKTVSNLVWRNFEYDIYNRIIKQYEPEFSSEPKWTSLFNLNVYDPYGRIIQVNNYNGKLTSINYNGLTTTTNDGVNNVIVVKNSIGNIISKSDNGGLINYKYFANGNLKESNFNGIIVNIEQNGWGKKTKIIDPSAGIYQYTYNEFGELLTETTPKGTFSYILDNVGSVIQKKIIGSGGDNTNSTTTYNYNASSKLLESVNFLDSTSNYSISYNYSYDNYKRLNQYSEITPYISYTREKIYDGFGRILKEKYKALSNNDGKSSEKIIRNTYKNGSHWQIFDDSTNQLLWQTSKVNEREQLVFGKYGNNIEVNNSYNTYGFPIELKHNRLLPTPTTNILTLNYSFDNVRGNLLSRNNNQFNFTENYTYDNLDRLTSYTDKYGIIKQQNYDNLGRITSNEVGVYNYTITDNSSPPKPKHFQNSSIETNVDFTDYYNNNRSFIFYNGMEQASGWKILDSSVSYDNTISLNGGKSLKINNSSNLEKVVQSENWTLINNSTPTQYTYSAWVKSNGTNPQAEILLLMKSENETNNYTLIDSQILSTNNNWNLIQKTFTIPANIKKICIRLDNNNNGVIWYDDIKIIKTNDALNNTKALSALYNVFKSPVSLSETNKGNYDFLYNATDDRSVMFFGGLQPDKLLRQFRKHYSADGSMEVKQDLSNNIIDFVIYIGGDAYNAPLFLKSDGTNQNYFYIHRDFQGSIVAITNQNGIPVEKRLFDAWGNVIKIQDEQGNYLTSFKILDRGYTGHEHLSDINIIHMNARLYDPVIHRFLQPDNFIQNYYNTQNFNRYSYVLNNPLKYTDLNGEWLGIDDIIAGVIGGVFNLGMNIYQGNLHGGFWNILGQGTAAFGAGFAAGTLSLYGPAGWVAGGAILGSTNSWLSGGNLEAVAQGTLLGAVSGFAGGYIGQYASQSMSVVVGSMNISSPILQSTLAGALGGTVAGGVTGGVISFFTGGDVMKGITQGAIMGAATGTITGGVAGYRNATKNGINPWNGKQSNNPEINWPKNNGAVVGTEENVILNENTIITRYGPEDGNYVSPSNTPFEQRSLPASYKNKTLNTYKVVKPIPNVQSSKIAPYFFQPGGGTQYILPNNVDYYLQNGYLIKL